MKEARKIVIKVGSSALTQGTQLLSRRYMLELAQQIAYIKKKGIQIALVSSGAVAAGREFLNAPLLASSSTSKQMFASIGQVKLMNAWSEIFSLLDLQVGQVLLTKDDFNKSKRHQTKDTLNCLLTHAVPIINENDTVACKKTRVGDNDNLAALVAHVIDADSIIILTDQDGLYTADPRLDPKATLISVVEEINEKIFSLAGGSSTSLGTGGMITKIKAAEMAAKVGIRTMIAPYTCPNVLIDLIKGQQIGTLFLEENINKLGKK